MAGAPKVRSIGKTRLINLTGFDDGQIRSSAAEITLPEPVISQDGSGIGIGTTAPSSALTVAGQIETKSGHQVSDGTVQSTSASGSLFQVNHDASLTGNGTSGLPLGIANGGVSGAHIGQGQVVKA